MTERCVKGDYIGFTFGDVHSSELGLMRVSDGSRYNEDLLPPLQDKTAQVNGRDGAIYFGSQYNTRPIKVPVAFDNMNEESFRKLKQLLQDKKPKHLWFDETPYRQWLVKSANAQNFKWVCFDETKNGGEKRIYKGEGTLEFSCFTPRAESRIVFLDEAVDYVWDWNKSESPRKLIQYFKEDRDYLARKAVELGKELPTLTLECNYNFNEWKEASGLRYKRYDNSRNYNTWKNGSNIIYNSGDEDANLSLMWFPNSNGAEFEGDEISCWVLSPTTIGVKTGYIKIGSFKLREGDYGFIIDSKLKMIKGIDQYKKVTSNVYTKFRKEGNFFKLPTHEKDEHVTIFSQKEYLIDYKYYYI